MLKLSKKVDYALIALMHLARQPLDASSSAREIATDFALPHDLLAKILQRLGREGLVASQQGTKGGYRLAQAAEGISVVRVIEAVEGPMSLTQCFTDDGACDQFDRCNIKSPLARLNDEVLVMLSRVTIASMCESEASEPVEGKVQAEVGLPILQ